MRITVPHTLFRTRGGGSVTFEVKLHGMKMLPKISNKISLKKKKKKVLIRRAARLFTVASSGDLRLTQAKKKKVNL